ncbi:MAG TPA: biosynthetic-type acetolactate synthase large subunit [bacterium]|mgnify:CR=1 FL=1|nr:biosynthetic-type acetolactate synthase large subunit [bacterium]HPG44203.1 biosynthetic-type acetolactate synthase large subunit [bacterium]HPM96570.1 biosynthetic-type acetolactate synthase large subunit [bacterium]
MRGAALVIQALQAEGVKALFGYPGGTVLDIFDEIYSSGLPFYLTRHEQGAVHAADGYARASGKVGMCIATSGPGATNLVTGIATAHMDSIPLVVLTGQVATSLIGNDAFQEVDICGITRSITKHNYLVRDIADLPQVLKSAFYIARSGRPGPVLIDLPKDIQQAETDEPYPDDIKLRSYRPTLRGNMQQLQKAAGLIDQSKKPVIFAGGGVVSSDAQNEIRLLSEILDAPVTTSLMGLGIFPETHSHALKMLGMHGTEYANYAVQEADLLIAVGVRFDDLVTGKVDKFAPQAQIIHIDIDPTSIRKNVQVTVPIVGDIRTVLQELNTLLKPRQNPQWMEQIKTWKQRHPLRYPQTDKVQPQYVIEQLAKLTDNRAIICTEVGQNQMWTAQFYNFHSSRSFLSSGGLGTMGYGFPAALGAQVAWPDKLVIDIAGDGSIQMNIQEMATAVLYDLPVKIIILNNHSLGMVRQWQSIFYDRRFSQTCLRRNKQCPPDCQQANGDCSAAYVPNFVKLAEAYGAHGFRIDHKDQVADVLQTAITTPGPVIVEISIDREENVYPMVPTGAPIHQMLRGMA